jgi:hypothetical protein
MNRKFLFLLAAGVFAALQACSGDVVEANNPVNTSGALKVLVTDASTGLPLEGATVTVTTEAGSKPATTNGLGIAEISGLFVGEHLLLVDKKGGDKPYTSMLVSATIYGDGGEENVYVTKDETASAELYPLTASLEGGFTIIDKDDNIAPAAGFEVVFIPDSYYNIKDEILPATTDEKGAYKFENLPAIGNNYQIKVLAKEIDGITYPETNGGVVNLVDGLLTQAGMINIGSGAKANFALIGCSNYIAPTDDVVCHFNQEIDDAKFKSNMITSSSVQFTVSISGKTVTLKTVGETKWTSSSYFYISFNNLVSKINEAITYSSSILINIVPEEVADLSAIAITDLALDGVAAASYASLKFAPVAGATSYALYWMDNVDKTYKSCGGVSVGTTEITGTCSFGALEGRTITIIAQASNSRSATTFAGAKTVVVE